MAQLFGSGSGKTVSTQAVLAQGMQVQSSQYGLGLPIVYGRNRVAGNLIWYGDFQAVKHVQNVGKGGGGQNVSYTYSSSFQLALCEGPGITVGQIWQDSGLVSLSDINGTFSGGAATQAAWSHLGSPYNLQYPYTAWIGCLNLKLGSTPTVPNFNFELNGLLQYAPTASPPIYDAEPSAIITDLLTSTTHGLGFQYLGDLTLFKDYCVANNIFLSPVIKQEESMSSILNRLLKITNSTTGWSNGKLIVIPYGDESVTANGVTYTPPTTIQKYFTEQDYIKSGVQITRKPLNDRYNTVRLQWTDPNNNYTPSVAEAKDQADIDASGIRQMETVQGNGVTNGTLAQWIAQTILQRNLYIRNEYTFTTTIENVALEAGDVIALTDSKLKLNQEPVRIVRIAEQNNDELEFTCEEFPAGVSVGATQTVESAVGFVPNITGAPDATQPPVIVRAPQFLTDGKPEIWIAAAGSGPNWGGCNVLISTDNVTYTKMGHIAPGCRYGVLTTQCATSASDPDTTNSFNVSLYGEGQLSGGTQADADNLLDLMLVDTELISYSSTVLNSDGTYSIGNGYMRRGCYETGIAQHAVGAPWIRLDDSVFPLEIDPSWVGQTLYIILQAWNLYGGGLQQLSTLTPTTYVVGTAEEIPDTPPTPTNLAATGVANGIHLTWTNPNPAAVAITSVERSPDNATWTALGQVQGTSYVDPFTGPATYYYRIRARSGAFIWSAYAASVQATGGSLDAVVDGASFVRLLASHAAGNVSYNFKGLWSATASYVRGDETLYETSYWLALTANSNSAPSTGNPAWQVVGSYGAYQGAWVATATYIGGAEVTASGNYWICVTGNTNSPPSTSNANWVLAGPQALDNIADGPNLYARVPISHFDNLTNRNLDLGYTVDNAGALRYAVSYIDGNRRALIDFSQTGHQNRNADYIPAGSTYAIPRGGILNNGVLGFNPVGKNLASNPGFESNIVGTVVNTPLAVNDNVGDQWYVTAADVWTGGGFEPELEYNTGQAYAGQYDLVIKGPNSNAVLAPNLTYSSRVLSQAIPVSAGQVLYYGAMVSAAQNQALPAGVTILVRVGLIILTNSGSTESYPTDITAMTSGYVLHDGTWQVPVNVISVQVELCYFVVTGASQVTVPAAGSICDARFDNVFCYVQVGMDNEIADGNVYQRMPIVNMDGNRRALIDFSQTGHVNKTLDNIADGSSRFAVVNGAGLNAINAVDSSNRVSTINGAVSPLGSIVTGSSTVTISYTSTTTSITISWTSGNLNRMDGSQTAVTSGSVTVTGLSASTTYYAAAYWDEVAQAISFVTGQSGAVGSPAILYPSESPEVAWQGQLQAHLNLGWVPVVTAASGGSGGGNGSSGCCLRGRQLIELASGVMREAQELTTGDVLSSPDGPTRITQLRFEEWKEWYRVEFNDGRILEVAPDHRFMDPSGVQIHARDLRLQTIVEARNCYLSVARLELCTDCDTKVSIEVTHPHVYYVDGVLSHNKLLC